MHFLNVVREFWSDLKTQKLRTTLTVSGIAWGTVAVVVLLAFGVGLEAQTMKRFHGLGERIVLLFGGRTTKAFQGFGDGRFVKLHQDDLDLLVSQIPEITEISPEYSSRRMAVRRGTASTSPNVTGVYPVYGDLRNLIAAQGGRFLTQADVDQRRRVAFLGNELKQLLFKDQPAVGGQILIGQTPFTVVGVMVEKQQNSSYNSRDKDRLFIPASTHRALYGTTTVNNFVYRTVDARVTKEVERKVYQALSKRYKFDPSDKDALEIWDTAEWEQKFGYMFLAFNLFFAIVGSFTMTVGGIGVANIMYIVVRERTREIGIKRSVGATKRAIMGQFFAETFFIVGLGAVLGTLLSIAVIKGSELVPMQEFVGRPTISFTVIATTLLLLAAIAFMAGLFPARKAANLDPVECLRY